MVEPAERFEAVAAASIEPLRRYLARRTDPETAADVLSETLLVAWRRLDEVPEPALPWLYRVAGNCLANAERSARRQRRVAGRIAILDPPRTVETPADPELDVVAALDRLPSGDAEVLRLWAWEQLGAAEIADVLAITPNAAAIRLHRARGRLRAELRKEDPAAGHEGEKEGRDD